MNLLSIKILFFSTFLTITSHCHAEVIRIINETNNDVYIATAYYRPLLERIDTDFPIGDILEIQKNDTIDILKPIKRGKLYKPIVFIASLEKKSIVFLDEIAKNQKQLQSKEDEINNFKKNLNFTQKIKNQELTKLTKEKDLLKKALEESEKASKKDILSVLTYKITDKNTYILKIDSNNKLTIESKKELISHEPKQQAISGSSLSNQTNSSKEIIKPDEQEAINTKLNNTTPPNKKPISDEPKNRNDAGYSLPNQANTSKEIIKPDEQKVINTTSNNTSTQNSHEPKKQEDSGPSLSNQANTHKEPIKIDEKQVINTTSNNTNPPKEDSSEKINNKDTHDRLVIANTAWEKAAQFRASNESWIINATGFPLEINQVHSKIFGSLPAPTSNSITIADNEAASIKPIDIKLLKWRYLLYKAPKDNQWRSLWMWPVWSAYIFDENNKIHKYSYAKKGAILTKDSTVTDTIYVAVYKYTKGNGALRVTPVTAIKEPEQPYQIPYFSNFEQFGYRQLVISRNEKTLAVKINEDGYLTLTKKNIPLSISQPNFTITENEKSEQFLYDINEWKEIIKNLAAPSKTISLSWFDNLILDKIEMGTNIAKKKLFDN